MANTRKPTCVFSEPVRVSVDELMTELLRRFPEEALADALRVATVNAVHRCRKDRHRQYKAERFFRHATDRLVNIPDDLAIVVGMKEADPQLPLFSSAGVVTDDGSNELEDPAPRKADESFGSLVDELKSFEHFETVFSRFPFVTEHFDAREGRLLVLGYTSGRNTEGKLVRRNCLLTHVDGNEQTFKSMSSVFGTLTSKTPDIHYFVKVIPYPTNAMVRFWTNIEGYGDDVSESRHLFLGPDGIEVGTRDSTELRAAQVRQATGPKKQRQAPQA